MKKIMFNDRFVLTKAVLDGTKTMTRRVIPELLNVEDPDISEWGLTDGGKAMITLYECGRPTTDIFPMYQPGEVVAVAQSYECMANSGYLDRMMETSSTFKKEYCGAGWDNKMFVRADLMPHQIEITDIKVERLQKINEEDCLKEGVWIDSHREVLDDNIYTVDVFLKHYCQWHFPSAREAFSFLIDKVSGKGTWESNPYVFAYSFKLIK